MIELKHNSAERAGQHTYSDRCLLGDPEEQQLQHTTTDLSNEWKLYLATAHDTALRNADKHAKKLQEAEETTQKEETGRAKQQTTKKERTKGSTPYREPDGKAVEETAPHAKCDGGGEQEERQRREGLAQGAQAEDAGTTDALPPNHYASDAYPERLQCAHGTNHDYSTFHHPSRLHKLSWPPGAPQMGQKPLGQPSSEHQNPRHQLTQPFMLCETFVRTAQQSSPPPPSEPLLADRLLVANPKSAK